MNFFRKWMRRKRQVDRLEYELARNQIQRVKKEEKSRVWKNIGVDLKQDHAGTKKLLYSMTKNCRRCANEQTDAIKDQNGQLLDQREDIADRWRDYSTNLLNIQRNTPFNIDPDLEADDVGEAIEDITDAELLEEISRMKRGYATEDDHLPVDILNLWENRHEAFY